LENTAEIVDVAVKVAGHHDLGSRFEPDNAATLPRRFFEKLNGLV
jgi:hypothetical protein